MKARSINLAIVSMVMISLQSYAGIPVSGVVSGTWFQGDTMEVVGDLCLPTDSTLTIEPSVVVKFMDYYRFYVYGLLLANGTADDSIKFTCDLIQNPNRWGGIRFSNANSSCSMSYCIIENGLAQNPEPIGGGAYCSNSSPTFSNCVFINNNSNDQGGGIAIYNNSSPDMSNCVISNNSTNTGGGGISINQSSPNLNNCVISENSASWGGGLNCGGNSSSEFTDCQFTENDASTFNGGAINCWGSTLTFYSCYITNNHLSGGSDGSGISAGQSTLTLVDCNITGNYNAYRGGGVFFYDGSSIDILDMTNCTISNNSASTGGGIYLDDNVDAQTMTNCTISNNSASNDGGGIYLDYTTIGMTNCELNNNTAGVRGGGMYIRRWGAAIHNCSFIANHAPGQDEGDGGGGIYINQGGINLTDSCLFEDNTAYRGGGIYGYSWSDTSSIEKCTFLNNSADPQGGGAIFNTGANVNITECLFEGNQCTGHGGGINNYDASPTISKCVFVGNSAVQQGGGIVNQAGGSPNIIRCTLYANSSSLSLGGGIACVTSSPTINSTIIDSSNGYGIYFGSGTFATNVKCCDFYNNFYNNFPIDFGGSDVPSGLGIIDTTNNNGDSCDAFFNIFLDPFFVDAGNGDFHLQSGSPCIDAGDPALGNDSDGTYPEIGRYYYLQTGIVNPTFSSIPLSFCVYQNYPNPFNPMTRINYDLPRNCHVVLDIYNLLGQKVTSLVDEHQRTGYKSVHWDSRSQSGDQVSSGIYFYRISAGDFVETRKMILLR